MQDKARHIEILEAQTGEVFPPGNPCNQLGVIRALCFAATELKGLAAKGNQGLPWTDGADERLTRHFKEGVKITELSKLHAVTYGAIKARLRKLGLL